MKYLLLCTSRSHGAAVWWAAHRCGYTTNVNMAGRYGADDAERIRANADDVVMIPETWVGKELLTRTIVDLGDANNGAVIAEMKEWKS